MSKVFIANYSAHDYSSAEQYGEIHYITKGYVSFYSLDRVRVGITQNILKTSPDDYLLLSGTSLICTMAGMIWILIHGKINILTWDSKKKAYRPLTITRENVEKLVEVLRDGAQPTPID